MPSDYYHVLGVSITATQDEIKKQYKKLAIKYHPDKTQDKDHHQKFLLVREAYDALKDEELRRKYNRENGISTGPSASAGYTSTRGSNYSSEYPFYSRHQHTRTSFAEDPFGASFFNLYLRGSKMYSDHFTRNSRFDSYKRAEDNAEIYAEYARRKMDEDAERRREQYFRDARKQREEEELRKKMEESLKRQKEERMKQQAAMEAKQAAQAAQAAFAKSRGFGDAKSEYESAKQEAHRRAREGEMFGSHLGHHPRSRPRTADHAEFIVVEDDEAEQEEENGGSQHSEGESESENDDASEGRAQWRFQAKSNRYSSNTGFNTASGLAGDNIHGAEIEDFDDQDENHTEAEASTGYPSHMQTETEEHGETAEEDESVDAFQDASSRPPTEYTEEFTNASFASENADGDNSHPRRKPEVVEVPEESENDHTYFPEEPLNTKVSSRTRVRSQSYSRQPSGSVENIFKNTTPRSSKKPRLADFDGMKSTLHTYFEDVDFSDIKSTLPDYSQRTRKASSSSSAQPQKRPRYAEYTDGTSRAETLYTPVNKAYSRKAPATISPQDLLPDLDDSRLLFTMNLPQIAVTEQLTNDEWSAYCSKVHEYQREFTKYREAVLGFQMGRLRKDQQHHNVIFADTSTVDVYLSCLFNDVLLLQNYTRALQEFRQTLKTFNVNCGLVEKMKKKPL